MGAHDQGGRVGGEADPLALPFETADEFLYDHKKGTLHAVADVHGLARLGDPETSRRAAERITGAAETRILRAFERSARYDRYPGWTDDEMCEWVCGPDDNPPTFKSARSRLVDKGLLVDSGERRPSSRGVPQIVWKLAG